jgi:phenylacetate-CoA ligase
MQCEVIDRYGLAEFGVVAYQLDGSSGPMQVLESECWVESASLIEEGVEVQELVITNFHNQLMPLIRYRTGDHSLVKRNKDGVILDKIVGRVHELVPINGKIYTTHYIQDIMDHRVGGIQEFQIDLRTLTPKLKIVPESSEQIEHISQKINQFWGNYFVLEFVRHEDLNRVGRHDKFRRLVTA